MVERLPCDLHLVPVIRILQIRFQDCSDGYDMVVELFGATPISSEKGECNTRIERIKAGSHPWEIEAIQHSTAGTYITVLLLLHCYIRVQVLLLSHR